MGKQIRNLAVGLPRRDDHLFVSLGSDRITGDQFCRAIGGGIDYGERAADALVREFREELDVSVTPTSLLGVIENIFTFEGEAGHEVVHVFSVESPKLDTVSLDTTLTILDVGTPARWWRLDELLKSEPPLYPAGILELI